ncbi:hypothetical protein GCM10020221_26920 [Streptomyces thioluteus]|uniref:Uncharacterized protein n=1 Tax=Streptomyces thioluteus TaxID=66431 RepID=A0ABP6JDC9_STRTU
MGIGAAGWVDADRNRVLFAPHLSWRNEPLRDRLASRLSVTVLVDNDANTAAWAEWRFGAGRGEDHLVMITLGTASAVPSWRTARSSGASTGSPASSATCRSSPAGTAGRAATAAAGSSTAPATRWCARPGELAAAESPVAYGIIDRVGGKHPRDHRPAHHRAGPAAGDAMCVELLQDIGQWLGVGIANLAARPRPVLLRHRRGVSAADDLLIGPARDAFRRHLTGRGYRPEPHRARPSSAPRRHGRAPRTWPAWSPAASAAPTGGASSATSVRAGRPRVITMEHTERETERPREPAGGAPAAPLAQAV